jgi:hypothetical protein
MSGKYYIETTKRNYNVVKRSYPESTQAAFYSLLGVSAVHRVFTTAVVI